MEDEPKDWRTPVGWIAIGILVIVILVGYLFAAGELYGLLRMLAG